MARQIRSEATRRKIIDAAIDVFGEVGYAAGGWGTVIDRTGMTKGALYHHFDSKETLASAIIEEGSDTLLQALRNVCGRSSPGLENLLHGTLTIVKVLGSDKIARTAEQLAAALGGYNEAASRFYASVVAEMTVQARRAVAEGDLRDDVDPELLGEAIVGTMFGMRLVSNVGRAGDLTGRLSQTWNLLLPGVVSEASLPYFQQFLGRELMRHAPATDPRSEVSAQPSIG